jgi:hypothetical protein
MNDDWWRRGIGDGRFGRGEKNFFAPITGHAIGSGHIIHPVNTIDTVNVDDTAGPIGGTVSRP